jgi:hypothetical protein
MKNERPFWQVGEGNVPIWTLMFKWWGTIRSIAIFSNSVENSYSFCKGLGYGIF